MNDFLIWNIDPVFVDLGFVSLRYYSLLYALGVGIFIWTVGKSFEKAGFPNRKTDEFMLILFVGMIVGARLGHVFFYSPGYYLSNPLEIVMIWKGGLASHGAAIAMAVSVWIFVKRTPQAKAGWIFDRCMFPILVTGALIRLGNFFNSEILGVPSDVPWAVIFERADTLPRHAVQLYESLAYALLALGAYLIGKKPAWADRSFFLSGYFFTGVFGSRLLLESLKSQQADYQNFLGVSTGQWLSIPFVAVGIALLFVASRREPAPLFYAEKPKAAQGKKNKAKPGSGRNRPA